MDVSAWWVLWAFLAGGWAGILLMAVMFLAAAEEARMESLPDTRGANSADSPQVVPEPM